MTKPSSGFTLIELLVVMAITAILVAIAFPSYTAYVQRGKRADARAALLEAAQFMERYYVAQSSYDAAALPPRLQTSPPGSAQALYTLSVTSSTGAYTLTATPLAADPCGALVLSHTGAKSRLGSGLSDAQCWR